MEKILYIFKNVQKKGYHINYKYYIKYKYANSILT